MWVYFPQNVVLFAIILAQLSHFSLADFWTKLRQKELEIIQLL